MLQNHTTLLDLNGAASDGGGYHAGSRAVEIWNRLWDPVVSNLVKPSYLSGKITWRKCQWNLLIFLIQICSISGKRKWESFWKGWKQLLLSGSCINPDDLCQCVHISTGYSPNVQGSTWVLQRVRRTWWVVGGRTCVVHVDACGCAGISILHNSCFYFTKVITLHPLKRPQVCVLCC